MNSVARYYFENIDDLVTLLESKPTEKLVILVGMDNPSHSLSMNATNQKEFAAWVSAKIKAGELSIKACEKTDLLPQGIKLTE